MGEESSLFGHLIGRTFLTIFGAPLSSDVERLARSLSASRAAPRVPAVGYPAPGAGTTDAWFEVEVSRIAVDELILSLAEEGAELVIMNTPWTDIELWRLQLAKYGAPTTHLYLNALRAFIERNPGVKDEFEKYLK